MAETGSIIVEMPLGRIIISGDNPRQSFDEESLRRLGESIEAHGQIQSVLVRPNGNDYELVVGERRLRACALIGLETIHAEIREIDDATAMELRLIENVHREDLSDAEKGNAVYALKVNYNKYAKLIDVANAINTPYRTVLGWTNKSTKLSDKTKKMMELHHFSEDHGTRLLKYSHSIQNKLSDIIVKHNISGPNFRDFIKLYDANPKRDLDDIANEVLGIERVTILESELTDKQKKKIEKSKEKTVPPDELRCIAITGSGTRCKNKHLPGKEYCGQHDPEKAEKKPFKYKKVKIKKDSPRFYTDPKKRSFDVWNIAAIDVEKPFGDQDPRYPGAIPGDIIANVLLWFLPLGGKVVDPMAGGGVTEDVCQFLGPKYNVKYEVLLYDNFSLPDYEYRESITFNDITTGNLPEEAKGANLIFADPPYGPQKDYGMDPDGLFLLLEGLAEASYTSLRTKGLVSVLMQNYYLEDECVGEFVPMIRKTAEIFTGEKKNEEGEMVLPRFKQIFEVTVPLYGKVARSEKHMTHIDRRLMVFQKVGS